MNTSIRADIGRKPAPAGPPRSGFTLVEALIATTIAAVAGSTLLIGISTTLRNTDLSVQQTMAYGLAEQLVDEIAGCRYADAGAGAYQIGFGPSAAEVAAPGRGVYDAIDDFDGHRESPPQDPWGRPLGEEDGSGGDRHANFRVDSAILANWRREIDVYYVSDADHSVRLSSGSSNHRAVEVRVYVDDPTGGRRELASVRRVFSYYPEP